MIDLAVDGTEVDTIGEGADVVEPTTTAFVLGMDDGGDAVVGAPVPEGVDVIVPASAVALGVDDGNAVVGDPVLEGFRVVAPAAVVVVVVSIGDDDAVIGGIVVVGRTQVVLSGNKFGSGKEEALTSTENTFER